MRELILSPAIWHVAFTRQKCEFFFDRLSPPGFRHVFCFGYCPHAESWVVYDASLNGVDLKLIPHGEPMAKFYQEMLASGATILRVRSGEKTPAWRHRFFFTCVTGVKQIVRSNSGALRPLGLLRDLIREGADIVFWRGQPYEAQTP